MQKILIATTNPGKFHEISSELADLSFKFVSLTDVGLKNDDVSEPFSTTWENALNKAKYFAKKSKLITITEDSGLFIKHLGGLPGVSVKRAAATPLERVQRIINQLDGVPSKKRQAYFETSGCVYDPQTENFHVFKGKVNGLIAEKMVVGARPGMEHDAIFYYPPADKTFSQMSTDDKNLVSHRGQVVNKIKIFLSRQYSARHFAVACGLIVKDRKLLLLKRRDHRKAYNNKWEFPGGGVDIGESPEQCLLRECKEETGYRLKIMEMLPKIYSHYNSIKLGNYQVFLMIFVCKILSGTFNTSDMETAGHGWFTLSEAIKLNLLPLNKKCIQDNKKILNKYID